jgi:hypothetical protein
VACAAVAGFAVDLGAVADFVGANPEVVAEAGLATIALLGLGEALGPVILGFAVLAVVALLTAVGLRRQPEA